MRNQREGSIRDDDEGRALLDKQVAQEEISGRALYLALLGVALVAFIGQLDGSIVAIALPSIAADLDATPSQYVWVGTSYMLSQTIMTPINGRLSDIVGRKPLVYAAVICMGVFSAVSGASKNIHMLLISRALTGLGGGSFTSLTPIIISDMVPYERRMAVQSYMGLIAALAGSMGPLFGGWLAENFSWRWCFYINVPTCILALIMLKLFLRLKPPAADTRHLRKSFDFMGLLLLTVGCASLTVGFANAADTSFINITAYIPIALGAASMIGAVVHILTTGKTAIIPKGLLTHRTPLFFLVSTLCQSLMFIPATFLLPQFFQGVKGYAAEEAGRQMIPYSISIACSAFIVGQIAGRLKDVRSIIWTGYLTQVFAYSLFALFLTQFVSKLHQQLLTALMAAGIGLAISPTMLVIQASVPAEDMAAATSGWVMVRSIGPSIGLALFNALLDTQVRSRFEQIEGYGKLFRAPHGKADYEKLHRLVEPLKGLVLGAFSASFRTCWTVGACLMAFALLLTLTTATRPLGDALAQEKEDEEEVIAPAVGAGSTYGAVGVATRA